MKKLMRITLALSLACALLAGCSDDSSDDSSSSTATSSTYTVGSAGYDSLQDAVNAVTGSSKGITADTAKTIILNKDATESSEVTVQSDYTGIIAIDFGSHAFTGSGIDFGSSQAQISSTGTVETSVTSAGTLSFVDDFTGSFKGGITANGKLVIAGEATIVADTMTIGSSGNMEIDAAADIRIGTPSGMTGDNVTFNNNGDSKPTITFRDEFDAPEAWSDKVNVHKGAYKVGDTYYASFAEAVGAIESEGNIELMMDATVSDPSSETITGKTLTINLGGHTLEFSATDPIVFLYFKSGSNVTIQNGSVKCESNVNKGQACFCVYDNSSLTLDKVNFSVTNRTGIQVGQEDSTTQNDDSCLTVRNSTYTVDNGYYCIATNNKQATMKPCSIDIEDSTLICENTDDNNDCCTVCMNVGGTVKIEDSTIVGGRQCFFLRGGKAEIEDTHFVKTGSYGGAYSGFNEVASKNGFGTGNELPQALVFIGNDNHNAYGFDSTATIEDSTFENKSEATLDADYANICISGHSYGNVDLAVSEYGGNIRVFDFDTAGKSLTVNNDEVTGSDRSGDFVTTATAAGKVTAQDYTY